MKKILAAITATIAITSLAIPSFAFGPTTGGNTIDLNDRNKGTTIIYHIHDTTTCGNTGTSTGGNTGGSTGSKPGSGSKGTNPSSIIGSGAPIPPPVAGITHDLKSSSEYQGAYWIIYDTQTNRVESVPKLYKPGQAYSHTFSDTAMYRAERFLAAVKAVPILA